MASGSCGTRDKLNPLCRPARKSDVLVGATLPAKKGQVYFGRFYLGKRRTPAVIRSACLMEIDGVFGSMRQILDLACTPGFCDNKPTGRVLDHMRCGRPIKILPHTSGMQANIVRSNRPFTAKKAASPSRKRPQILRIDDGKGFRRFGAPC